MKLSEAIAALERGEKVEVTHYTWNDWEDFTEEDNIGLNHAKEYTFRLKSKLNKPTILYVNIDNTGDGNAYSTKEKALDRNNWGTVNVRFAVPFREVVPLESYDLQMLENISKNFYNPKNPETDFKFLFNLLKRQGVINETF